MEIMRATAWADNAEMIEKAVVPLGYIEGRVLDATYGHHGGFWTRWQPDDLTTNDLYAPTAEYHYDFRAFPSEWDGAFDTVVYDPPYKLNGTPQDAAMDHRFGTDQALPIAERTNLVLDGAMGCARTTRKWLLVKCQDQVVSGQVYWQAHAIAQLLDHMRLVDRFDLIRAPRPQPGNRPQKHARSNYSTLLVFRS